MDAEALEGGLGMRWLKILLAVNGVAYLFYGASNIVAPTSYFLPTDAPQAALDAVRAMSTLYAGLGLIQLGSWWLHDRSAVQLIAGASLLAVGAFAIAAALVGTGSSDPFHQLSLFVAVGNGAVAALYAVLLYRERMTATA